ncbi:MAG: hypothetical protein KDC98_07085, partial [Planctomycetes bacterium]|nr:hypothetical protein [Planctomycetota bacterium]
MRRRVDTLVDGAGFLTVNELAVSGSATFELVAGGAPASCAPPGPRRRPPKSVAAVCLSKRPAQQVADAEVC